MDVPGDAETVVVAERFCGPPASGNGGYVCGLAAGVVGGEAEVTLRVPPPLERPLAVVRDAGQATLMDGDVVVAHARPAVPDVSPPAGLPTRAEAEAASARFPGFSEHAFPTCFTCGPRRAAEDGLRIFAGPVREGLSAAPWTPAPDLAAGDGLVRDEFMWAALDCPSYWCQPGAGSRPAVLARLRARVVVRPAPGLELVVTAWPLGSSGRKHRAATAIHDGDGRVLATAEALWIEVDPTRWG